MSPTTWLAVPERLARPDFDAGSVSTGAAIRAFRPSCTGLSGRLGPTSLGQAKSAGQRSCTLALVVLANSIPEGVGARRLRSFQVTPLYHRLQVALVGLLSVHWLVVSYVLIGSVHALDASIQLPAAPGASFLVWSALFYIIALPLLAPLFAWIWVRQVRATTESRRVARWATPAALALYGLHLAYYVPFMTVLD